VLRNGRAGQVSAARQAGAGKTRTATPQNGQSEPAYHFKEARTRWMALEGKARYVVSGDKDLLALKRYRNVQIITPVAFLEKRY